MSPFKKYNIVLLSVLTLSSAAIGSVYIWSERENNKISGLSSLSQHPPQTGKVIVPAADDTRTEKTIDGSETEDPSQPSDVPTPQPIVSATGELSLRNQSEGIWGSMQKFLPAQSVLKNILSASSQPADFSFVVVGDSEKVSDEGYEKDLPKTLEAVKSKSPHITFFSGDMVELEKNNDDGNRMKVQHLKELFDNTLDRYSIAFGESDIACGQTCVNLWREIFFGQASSAVDTKLFHSFDYQNTHFILLSSAYPKQGSIDESQLSWVKRDLAGTSKEHKIVITHIPPVTFFKGSAGECQDTGCDDPSRQALTDLFRKYNVDLVISGHEHAFDHKIVDNIDYVLSGSVDKSSDYDGIVKGDIFTFIEVRGQKISLKAFEKSGRLIREIIVKE